MAGVRVVISRSSHGCRVTVAGARATFAQADAGAGARLSSVVDHRAGELAGLHRLEGLVDLLDSDGAGDQLVQLGVAGTLVLDQPRDVAPDVGRAVPAALDRLLGQHD